MIISNLQEFHQLLQSSKPILAVDYGQKKLGLAISDPNYTISMPLKTLNCINDSEKIKIILSFIDEYSACALVIGLPIMMDGAVSNQALLVQNFTNCLSTKTDLPIYMQDERLTSRAANNLLKYLGLKRNKRNQQDDCIAAGMILETVLSSIKFLN
ncbi:Holliday junction resolvase RuvX [Candidatus Trichorickettsia mobilis]|uniref:Putative pre-16S rRNA nuclease n=1 Tax=Candidatus Trichorickettsia mobilis TaxID=1346319 RepID=A0ABZ0UT70_9RICK|nr:Holliday junction resolvase RuvX [Candidatus Trichorickettsia mobilis]WPY00981.1 Holliday junction resolvase RuvX [Candidatus Trichorickettsia mobilis]